MYAHRSDTELILPPQFLGSTAYYAMIAGVRTVAIDQRMPFDKRFKSIHRCTVDGANGPSFLTVPVQKPHSMSSARWNEITVSAHGGWWNEMLTALHSAYGRTPFFEFYIDEFTPFFSSAIPGMSVLELDRELDTLMRRLFLIDTPVRYITDLSENGFKGSQTAFTGLIEESAIPVEYYQIRAFRHGFQPFLSSVDLLFNMGPESPLILRRMCRHCL